MGKYCNTLLCAALTQDIAEERDLTMSTPPRDTVLRSEMPEVAEQFYNLTKSVKGYSPFTEKWNELLLVAIFATHRALRGLGTHIRRAMAEGATKEEILSAILLALPVIGAPDINAALERTLEVIQEQEEEQAELRKL